MNLALKDIRHGLFRFVLTCFGLGLLMTVVLSMIGIYNGLVADALADDDQGRDAQGANGNLTHGMLLLVGMGRLEHPLCSGCCRNRELP